MAKQIVLTSPADGAINQPTHPLFRWSVSALDAPTELALISSTPVTLDVAWTALSGAGSYNIYLNDSTQPLNTVSTFYQFTGLTPSAHYKVELTGVTAGGVEGPRARLDADTMNPYSSAELSYNSVRLYWAAVANATEYRIFNSTLLMQSVESNPNSPTLTTTLTGLLPNTSYTLRIAAVVGGAQQLKYPTAGIIVTTPSDVLITMPTYTTVGPQSVTVPVEATRMLVKAWGAGGGCGYDVWNIASGSGGGGGYAEGETIVSPGESLLVYVGGGGTAGTNMVYCGGGGGLSGVFRGSTPLLIAGSGGGGAAWSTATPGLPGGAGGGANGIAGGGADIGGMGGTQTAGGRGGNYSGTQTPCPTSLPGDSLMGGGNTFSPVSTGGAVYGGNGGLRGAGGGAGYYGGGAGSPSTSGNAVPWGGGGGGSSLVPPNGITFPGTGRLPGNMNDPVRPSTAGMGGTFSGYNPQNGGNGAVVISFKR